MSCSFAMPIYYKMCTTAVKLSLRAPAAKSRESQVEMHAWSKSHLRADHCTVLKVMNSTKHASDFSRTLGQLSFGTSSRAGIQC